MLGKRWNEVVKGVTGAQIIDTYLDIARALEGSSFSGEGVALAGETALGIGTCQKELNNLK